MFKNTGDVAFLAVHRRHLAQMRAQAELDGVNHERICRVNLHVQSCHFVQKVFLNHERICRVNLHVQGCHFGINESSKANVP